MDMTIRRSRRAATGLTAFAAAALACITAGHAADPDKAVDKIPTASPIKHVIIIVGENRSFDHLFATYVPKGKHERVLNLLSQGIIKADGSPGPNFAKGHQFKIIAAAERLRQLLHQRRRVEQDALPVPAAAGSRRRAESAGRLHPDDSGRRSGPAAAGPVPVRHRRHRAAQQCRPRHPHHQRQRAAARPFPDDRPDHAV